jgi:hypothetical protein
MSRRLLLQSQIRDGHIVQDVIGSMESSLCRWLLQQTRALENL